MALHPDMFGNFYGLKRCARCKRLKEYFEFNLSKTSRDGYQSYCKACQREYRQRHPDKEYKKNRKDGSLKLEL